MLVNTAPQPECGASAAQALFQLADQGVGELKFGELTMEAISVLEPDGLERLVLTRGLLTCCKTDILSCQLESSTHQACLLLDVLFPTVCALSKEQKDCHYYCFQVFSLWLQRLQESLPEIWRLKGSRILAEDSDLLSQLTQLVWNNAETPVEGVSEFIHNSFRLLLEMYCLECRHFEDQERPLYRQMLQRVISMPWQIKARYVPLCAIVPYVGSQKVLDAYQDLPQHLLSCLATNHLCPAATEVYKALVQQQRAEWLAGRQGPEEALAKRWARHWLPLLSQALRFVEWLLQLSVSSLSPGSNYQRKKTALLLLAAVLETCTDTWSPERKKGQPPQTMAALLSYARHRGCWDFFSQPNLLALLSCLQDSTNEIRDLASELLVRYFPAPLPEPVALALFQLAQEALSSPRVQEAEAGAVLMKTILQKSDSSTVRSLPLEAGAAPTLQPRGLCFAQHLLHVLQAQYAAARQDLLQAAATKPMHGAIAALRRCLLQVPEVAASMRAAEWAQSWQELLTSLVATARDITSFLLGALQSQQGPGTDQQATAPSFADMGNAIGSLIMLGKGQGQQEDDSVLLSEEHSLILTCCWVSVKEIGLLLGGLVELLLSPAPAGPGPLLPLARLQTGAVEGCSMGFTKFCAALRNHPDTELQAIPQTMLAQVGSAVLHQTIARFLCSEAARLADEERIGTVCLLLQEPNTDVQFAILSWVIKGEGGECETLEKALRLTLLENLQSVLQDRRNKEFLKLYLEALMHLYRNPSSWSQDASCKLQGSSSACVEILLLMMETEHPGPDLLFQALCAASLLLTLGSGDEAQPLVERWCAMLERCSKCVSSEVLRLAAARSLQLAGVDVVQRCRGAVCPSLVPVALRLINVGIHLLQDEEQEVRHEASNFASLVRQVPEKQVQGGCIFVQANTGLLGLLQLLLENFGDHPETFGSLLQHLPLLDLRGILEELEANKASSLYKEDEPNVFAEPAVLSQLLLPFLLQLLEKASVSSPLHESALCWLEAVGPSILRDLQYCKCRWSQEAAGPWWMKALGCAKLHTARWQIEAAGPWWMKALGCAKLHTAVAVLLARAKLLARALEVVHGSAATAPQLGCRGMATSKLKQIKFSEEEKFLILEEFSLHKDILIPKSG
nr:PREDICTED: uncharacterized protein LOC104138924 [Struthio camelus australis]